MPPKKPRPADTGGVPKQVRTGALTGETPVKEHIKKIEKNGGKEAPEPTGEKKSREKVSRKQPVKAQRRMPTLQEGVEENDWEWDTPKKHSTPKSENVGKEGMEEAGMGDAAKINASTLGGSKTGQANENQGPPEPPPGPKPGGGTGPPGHFSAVLGHLGPPWVPEWPQGCLLYTSPSPRDS